MGSRERAVILRAVDDLASEAVDLLRSLVRVASVTGAEGAAQALVAEALRETGFAVDLWEPDPGSLAPHTQMVGEVSSFAGRPNVVGTLTGAGGGRTLMLSGHIDTVSPGEERRWTRPPFAAEISDGKLYGLGACDMKAGLVAEILAVRALQRAGLPPGGDVLLTSVVGEEDGGAGTVACLLRGYRADGAIIAEPTRLSVVPAVAGSAMFRLRVTGRSAHASVRDEGVSAVEKFCLLLKGLREYERRRNGGLRHPLYEHHENKVPIEVGTVRAGDWPSSVPELLVAEGRAGLLPGEELEWFQTDFERGLKAWAGQDPWLAAQPPTVEWFPGQFAPAEVAPDCDLVRAIATNFERASGEPITIEGATYGSDMRHFINLARIPTVMFGPGDVRVAHYTDEFVCLDELVTAAKVLALTIHDWGS